MPAEQLSYSGVHTALPTPFSAGGEQVDYEQLDAQVRYQASGGVRGVVPCGTTGETSALSEEERRGVISRVVKAADPLGLTVIAGAGSNATAKAIDYQHEAEDLGVDATLQVVPYYNKPSQEGLYRHFHAIADIARVPIVLYDVPSRTGTGLTVDTVERLARHPRIQAIKAASGSLSFVTKIVERCNIAVLSGDDELTFPIQCLGGVGVISVVSNLVPDATQEMCDQVNRGDLAMARSLHGRYHALAAALVSLDSNPVPLKSAMAMLGRDSGVVRPPLAPMDSSGSRVMHALLEETGVASFSEQTGVRLK